MTTKAEVPAIPEDKMSLKGEAAKTPVTYYFGQDGPAYVLLADYERLLAQRNRIIDGDTNRDSRLRAGKAWHPIRSKDRPDCLAWREGNDSTSELLMYNNALCDPFYVATGMIADDAKAEIQRLETELRERTRSEERLRDRERDLCAAVTRCCDVKKINEIMQDTLKAREARAKGE